MKFVIFCASFDITTMQQSHLFFQHFLPSFIYDLLYFSNFFKMLMMIVLLLPDKNKYNILHKSIRCAALRCACAVYCATIKLAVFKDKREDILCGKSCFDIGVFLPLCKFIHDSKCLIVLVGRVRLASSFWCVGLHSWFVG